MLFYLRIPAGINSPLTNDFYVRAYDAHPDGNVYGYWDVSWDSCVWYRYSKIIPITAKLITGGFALSGPILTTVCGTFTRVVVSTVSTTICIGIPVGLSELPW